MSRQEKRYRIFLIGDGLKDLKGLKDFYDFECFLAGRNDEICQVLSCYKHNFDLIMIDTTVQFFNSEKILRDLGSNYCCKDIPIVLIIGDKSDIDIINGLNMGADDYISFPFDVDIFSAKVRAIIRRSGENDACDLSAKEKNVLTQREIEVLKLIAEGHNNKEVAHKLLLSELTVKTHLKNIFKKLNVLNRTQAILTAISSGLISGGLKNFQVEN